MRYAQRTLTIIRVGFVVFATAAVANGQSIQRQMVVSVVDAGGVPITGLTPSDFVVREDGAMREVLSVRPDTEPKQIALLVDTSQAVGAAMGDFKRAAAAFVDAMSGDNEISIISFGGTPRILTASTNDPARLREGVDKIFSYSDTASYLLDAVSDTAQGFVRQAAPRPVIVILSALGIDYSNANDQTALNRLKDAGIPMHTVILSQSSRAAIETIRPGGNRPPQRPSEPELILEQGFGREPFLDQSLERDRFLNRGPSATGGRRRDLVSSGSSEQAFTDLAEQLRGQYLVVYSRPGMLIPPERIEIAVNRDDLEARGTPIGLNDSDQ